MFCDWRKSWSTPAATQRHPWLCPQSLSSWSRLDRPAFPRPHTHPQVTTDKSIRKQLEGHFGVAISGDTKALVKEQVGGWVGVCGGVYHHCNCIVSIIAVTIVFVDHGI
jgi:hypothetical protein